MRSSYADVDDEVLETNDPDSNKDPTDVQISLLTAEEREINDSVRLGENKFRKPVSIECQGNTWVIDPKHEQISEVITNLDISLYDVVQNLYQDDFEELLQRLQEDDARIHECGGITLILARGEKETRVAMRAATAGVDVSEILTVFNVSLICRLYVVYVSLTR